MMRIVTVPAEAGLLCVAFGVALAADVAGAACGLLARKRNGVCAHG